VIRLTLVALGRVHGESWRVPVGRGSVTAFEVEQGEIGLCAPPAGGAADTPRNGLAGGEA
jgi:hypothetical protein